MLIGGRWISSELADNCCGVPVSPHYWLWAQSIVIDSADLKTIAAPVLVVAGDHDLTSIEETTEIFRDLPHGNLFVVPGTGHDTYQTRPELVNLAIREFLDQPDSSARSH